MRSLLFCNFEPKIPKFSKIDKIYQNAGTVSCKKVNFIITNNKEIINHLKELEEIIRIKAKDQKSLCWIIHHSSLNIIWNKDPDFLKCKYKNFKIGAYNNWHIHSSLCNSLYPHKFLIGIGNSLNPLTIARINFVY